MLIERANLNGFHHVHVQDSTWKCLSFSARTVPGEMKASVLRPGLGRGW